jgi:hypothetical protein
LLLFNRFQGPIMSNKARSHSRLGPGGTMARMTTGYPAANGRRTGLVLWGPRHQAPRSAWVPSPSMDQQHPGSMPSLASWRQHRLDARVAPSPRYLGRHGASIPRRPHDLGTLVSISSSGQAANEDGQPWSRMAHLAHGDSMTMATGIQGTQATEGPGPAIRLGPNIARSIEAQGAWRRSSADATWSQAAA